MVGQRADLQRSYPCRSSPGRGVGPTLSDTIERAGPNLLQTCLDGLGRNIPSAGGESDKYQVLVGTIPTRNLKYGRRVSLQFGLDLQATPPHFFPNMTNSPALKTHPRAIARLTSRDGRRDIRGCYETQLLFDHCMLE
jgi:hypothetical protein